MRCDKAPYRSSPSRSWRPRMKWPFAMRVTAICSLVPATSVRAGQTPLCPALLIPNEIVQAIIQTESRRHPLVFGAMIEGTHQKRREAPAFRPGRTSTWRFSRTMLRP